MIIQEVPVITCANCGFSFEATNYPKPQACPKCGSVTRIVALSGTSSGRSTTTATLTVTIESAPPFSFGAIVTLEKHVAEGTIIKLVDPVYAFLIQEIQKEPNIMYQIDPRKWEEIIAAAYDKAGFDEVILTPRSGDYGRDIIAMKHGFGSVKFIDQVKAYRPGHIVRADEVRALLGVLHGEQDASKAIFTTTSTFAPRLEDDKFIKPFLPFRLELIDKEKLIQRLVEGSKSR